MAVEALIDDVGEVDILVNNAAILIERVDRRITIEHWDRTMAVNVRAPFQLSRGLGAGMRERGWGRIVNIASIAARTGGMTGPAAYATSKGALVTMTKHFARNYGPHGVTVNVIAPAGIMTPDGRRAGSGSPGLRGGLPAAVRAAASRAAIRDRTVVSFLASDGAAYMTGATIDVNGGWFMY